MRKINAVPVCLLFFATTVHAVTIEEIAARNNRTKMSLTVSGEAICSLPTLVEIL